MVRGISYFKCEECGKHFKGPDIEVTATIKSMPLQCPSCGSKHTHPTIPYLGIWDFIRNCINR